ncbi:hypothetical protein EVAR_48820_1 [Eumeta japonica]|uniref:Uncharacterized protein n=1 Tax=Eumeta variegata TaxID=151549 RepID=A0A4C1Y3Q2_EUMVA|nr:hypothetical protein EVAR_48820_1 [Eumeta japonica]
MDLRLLDRVLPKYVQTTIDATRSRTLLLQVLRNDPYPSTLSLPPHNLNIPFIFHRSSSPSLPGRAKRGLENSTTLNVCSMDDKIDSVCTLMKERRLYILCVNETKRNDSGGAIKCGSIETYWSGVDQSQRECRVNIRWHTARQRRKDYLVISVQEAFDKQLIHL